MIYVLKSMTDSNCFKGGFSALVFLRRATVNNRQLKELQDQLKVYVEEAGYELLDLEYIHNKGDRILRFYIYHPEGINADDCEKVSNILNPVLDDLDPIENFYYLEVSSPDLSRPFTNDRYFEIHRGEILEFNLYGKYKNRKTFNARLIDFDDKVYKLEETGDEGNEFEIERNKVASVKIVLNF